MDSGQVHQSQELVERVLGAWSVQAYLKDALGLVGATPDSASGLFLILGGRIFAFPNSTAGVCAARRNTSNRIANLFSNWG